MIKKKDLGYIFNPRYMSQKLLRYPILTMITKNPGTVNPSNKPNIQKHIEPAER